MSVVKPLNAVRTSSIDSVVGELVEVNQEGIAMVDFPGNQAGPVVARSTLTAQDQTRLKSLPATITLVFEDNDMSRPIITGIVADTLFGIASGIDSSIEGDSASDTKEFASSVLGDVNHALVDGKKVTLDAQEEIRLQCGKSSILLRKDGKVIIKGAQVVSRSSGSNKIKGSSVNIN